MHTHTHQSLPCRADVREWSLPILRANFTSTSLDTISRKQPICHRGNLLYSTSALWRVQNSNNLAKTMNVGWASVSHDYKSHKYEFIWGLLCSLCLPWAKNGVWHVAGIQHIYHKWHCYPRCLALGNCLAIFSHFIISLVARLSLRLLK